jgi:outer membrane PBP1 activator LpoA protein
LPDPAARKANDQWLWDILQQQQRANLDKLTRASANDINLQAWLSLALISQNQRQNPQLFKKQWQAWQARFPNHPAAQFVQTEEATSSFNDHSPVSLERVAVLLPLTGRYSAAANAIRDGMLAAYYEDRQHDSGIRQIHFYDSGESSQNIVSVYQQALNDEAQAVVGPLAKEAITTLIRSGQIRTPVIALNQIESSLSPPPQLYQFTLAPEQEARQVAERAILDGHHRALALVPQGEWGTRILAAFTTRYQELGGQVVAHATYSNNTTSYGNVIKQLLRVADNTPGQRRTDIDMMFMAAFPTQGRLLRPLLNFNFAADLPVYATSHIYSGKANPDADQDLEGVIFPSMPWLISAQDFPAARQLARQWPSRFADQTQLFALGYDAFHLLTLTQDPELLRSFYAGATGKLHLEPNHVIDHQLQWASFAKGNITHVSHTAQTQTQPLDEQTH